MRETPFSPDIQPFQKPVEVGDTNDIYYDPRSPDTVIRIPKDEEARFLETDPKLIAIAEKNYSRLEALGTGLDIDIAPHQFILAKENSTGPVKPMLLAKRIEGKPLFPVDQSDPKTLESISRIAQLGLKYIDWIESDRPRSVVTDVFRPEQYIVHPGEKRDQLTLVDIEPRLKDRDTGKAFIEHQIAMLVAPLRDSAHNDVFLRFMRHAFQSFKRDRSREMGGIINIIVKAPDFYRQMSDDFFSGAEPRAMPDGLGERLKNTPLIIDRRLLKKFGIEKI
jgi:hypothetical protein